MNTDRKPQFQLDSSGLSSRNLGGADTPGLVARSAQLSRHSRKSYTLGTAVWAALWPRPVLRTEPPGPRAIAPRHRSLTFASAWFGHSRNLLPLNGVRLVGVVHRRQGFRVLGPDDLRIAADAFEDALKSMHEDDCEVSPHTARQMLARYIVEKALAGERDRGRLRDGALDVLRTAGAVVSDERQAAEASLAEPGGPPSPPDRAEPNEWR